jgi:uncharacterized protein YbjT (DUF2867 family)
MILVTAATGKVGRELVDLLLQKDEKVAAVTRNPSTATLPHGAQVSEWRPISPCDPEFSAPGS